MLWYVLTAAGREIHGFPSSSRGKELVACGEIRKGSYAESRCIKDTTVGNDNVGERIYVDVWSTCLKQGDEAEGKYYLFYRSWRVMRGF